MRTKQQGFTLAEIAIAMVVGLLATLAIFQTLSMFEKQRRTTAGAGDAQENGLIALYTLEQDLREGGHGLIDNGVLPCAQIYAFSPNSVQVSAPALIQGGATAGASDTLFTNRLDADSGGIVTGGQRAIALSTTLTLLTVDTGKAINANDYLLVSDPVSNLPCTLLKSTATPSATLPAPVPVSAAVVANPAGTASSAISLPAYSSAAKVNDLGPTLTLVSSKYYVDSNFNLMQSDNGATAQSLASNIVNMQAQYGVTIDSSEQIKCWTNPSATGAACAPGDWTPAGLTRANISRIKAIRLAVVVRSGNKESAADSSGACNTTTLAPVSWPDSDPSGSQNFDKPPTIDLSANGDWKCYRYKVYQTIIPLRNVIWQNL